MFNSELQHERDRETNERIIDILIRKKKIVSIG